MSIAWLQGLYEFDNCRTCVAREQHLFCGLSPLAAQRLKEITSTAVYPNRATLFIEGQEARGVFVLCSGKAKLFTTSRVGRTIITQICQHGEVLGLNATISHRRYEVTAEMLEPGKASFIMADALSQFLLDYEEVASRVARELSLNYYTAYEEIRTLGLSKCPASKFAKLLLSWLAQWEDSDPSRPVRLLLTQAEIAEMIGTTRETVSRLFSDFKVKRLIQSNHNSVLILDKPALERMVNA